MLDLITGHQGFLHITAEQISEVNRSITAGYGDNAVLRLKDGTLSSTGLSIGIAAGYWRANGFDVEITSAETIYIDPSSVGTSRIDKFYIELLQDIPSGNQRAELVYVKGTEASVPVAPSDPTAPVLTTDILLECVCYASALIEENSLSLTDLTKVIQNVTPEDMTRVKSWIRNNADVYSSLVTHDKGEIVLNALDGKVYECVHSCPAYSWESNSQYYEERTIIDILDRINQQAADFHKYGTCPTAASTSKKKVTTRLGDWTLETGKVVYVAFSYTNTAATPTLNVDNTGAKEIKGYGSTAPSSWWKAGDKVQFLYDGVYYIMFPSQGQITDLNNELNAQHRRKRKSISANDLRACITNDGVDLSIKDITIGDYITINSNYKAVVADIDTFYGGYDSYAVVNSHHIAMLIVGTAGSVTQKWNSSDTTSSGYNGSALHTALKNLISTIEGTLGTLISHQKLLTTATSNWAWQASQKISALTESQIYGAPIWSIDGYQQGEAWKQLEIFRKFSFNEIFGNQSVWLRSIRSASVACHASSHGSANLGSASAACGVVGLVLFH